MEERSPTSQQYDALHDDVDDPAASHGRDFDAEELRRRQRGRRRRAFYTPCQLAYLETAFNCAGHYPDQRQREQLARALDVAESRVQVCRAFFSLARPVCMVITSGAGLS